MIKKIVAVEAMVLMLLAVGVFGYWLGEKVQRKHDERLVIEYQCDVGRRLTEQWPTSQGDSFQHLRYEELRGRHLGSAAILAAIQSQKLSGMSAFIMECPS